jgi:NADPH2:quinone reductase
MRAIPLPANTSFAAGAGLGVPAMTAHRCVFADGPVTGKTVLVTGALAVGHYAIQLAKLHGAHVITMVSSDQKAQIALPPVPTPLSTTGLRTPYSVSGTSPVGRRGPHRRGRFAGNFTVQSRGAPRQWHPCPVFGGRRASHTSRCTKAGNITVRFVLVYEDMPEAAKQAAVQEITQLLEGGSSAISPVPISLSGAGEAGAPGRRRRCDWQSRARRGGGLLTPHAV